MGWFSVRWMEMVDEDMFVGIECISGLIFEIEI
jgi:hypothetical protein